MSRQGQPPNSPFTYQPLTEKQIMIALLAYRGESDSSYTPDQVMDVIYRMRGK